MKYLVSHYYVNDTNCESHVTVTVVTAESAVSADQQQHIAQTTLCQQQAQCPMLQCQLCRTQDQHLHSNTQCTESL